MNNKEDRRSLEEINEKPWNIKSDYSPLFIPAGYASKWYKDSYWKTNEGCEIHVIEYKNKNEVIYEFTDNIGVYYSSRLAEIRSGKIKNPYKYGKYGGYFGEGEYTKRQHLKMYDSWKGMIERCSGLSTNPRNFAYENVSICPGWQNYQNFAKWYDGYISQLNPEYYNDYQIDKDILQWDKYYKIYCPGGCCIIPSKLNNAFAGMSHERVVESDLPIGVHASGSNKSFIINISVSIAPYQGTFEDPMKAFLRYKELKTAYIRRCVDECLANGQILPHVRDAVYSIDIKPFPYMKEDYNLG